MDGGYAVRIDLRRSLKERQRRKWGEISGILVQTQLIGIAVSGCHIALLAI
jgi:hypothetical protein